MKDYIHAQEAIRDMGASFSRLQQDYVVVDTNMRHRQGNGNIAVFLNDDTITLSEKLKTLNACLLKAGFQPQRPSTQSNAPEPNNVVPKASL